MAEKTRGETILSVLGEKISLQELKKLQIAAEYVSDQIIVTDQDGIILYVNKATEKNTGFSKEELVGRKAGAPENWGGMMDKKYYQKFWRTIKVEKKFFHGEFRNKRKGGKIYEAEVNITPVSDKRGKLLFFVGIERDITEEKEIDRAKTEFVALASHQLRTPLSTINWYAEMLIGGDVGKLNPDQKKYLEEIYHSNQRMVSLVNALLNVSRIELGTLAIEPQPTNLAELADKALEELSLPIKEHKLKIEKNYDKTMPLINLDPKLIKVVFNNLFSNAVKYNHQGGKIIINISKQKKDALFSVADTGYGIPEHQQSRIFTKLFRADNIREKEPDGTGLGLYIVKSVVEESGGKIWFESREGQGTTFFITLPLEGMPKRKGAKGLEYTD